MTADASRPKRLVLQFPYVLKAPMGGNARGNWRVQHFANVVRPKEQLSKAWDAHFAGQVAPAYRLPLIVWCIRIAPQALDWQDNLPRAFKAFCDGLAKRIGFDDRTLACFWKYDQRPGRLRVHPRKAKPATRRRPEIPAVVEVPAEYTVRFEIEEAICEVCGLPLMGLDCLDRSETGFRCSSQTQASACTARRAARLATERGQ